MINLNQEAKEYDKSKCKHFRREHTKEEVYDSFEEGFIAGANSKHVQSKIIQAQIDIIQSLYQHFGADSYMAYLGEKLDNQLKQLENEANNK
jgi:hypothetical protein